MASQVVMENPLTRSSDPAGTGTRATATLSDGWSWMTEFSAVGSFAISRSILFLGLGRQVLEEQFGRRISMMHVQLAPHRMDPHAVILVRKGNLSSAIHQDEAVVFGARDQAVDVNVHVALGAAFEVVDRKPPSIAPTFRRLGDGGGPVFRPLHGG